MGKVAYLVLAVLIVGAALYFLYTAQSAARSLAPGGGGPAAEAGVSTTAAAGASATTPRLPFGGGNYEVNYTVSVTVSIGGVSVSMRGWSVEGAGPLGNYSFGVFYVSVPPRGPLRIEYKVATEGRTAYVVTCAGGQCQGEMRPANSSSLYLLRGEVASARSLGPCSALGYTGVEVEESGRLAQGQVAELLGDLGGNGTGTYTVRRCVVNGVALKSVGTAYLNVTVYGQRLTVAVSVESAAVSAGPFDGERYRGVLAEAKAAAPAKA